MYIDVLLCVCMLPFVLAVGEAVGVRKKPL